MLMTIKNSTEWMTGFNRLRQYAKIAGDSKVPPDYVTKDGFKLGAWVSAQRTMYRAGELSRQAVGLLKSIPGWKEERKPQSPHPDNWRRAFKKLQTYVRREGHYSPPLHYVTPGGFRLGAWTAYQRVLFNKGILAPERKKLLETLPGWRWKLRTKGRKSKQNPRSSWAKKWRGALKKLRTYVRREGHYSPPADYVTPGGFRLGAWAAAQRHLFKKGILAPERKKLLESIPGWRWKLKGAGKNAYYKKWLSVFRKLRAYAKQKGCYSPPANYVTKDQFRLGAWAVAQRVLFKKGLLSPERKKLLETIPGWRWKLENMSWRKNWLDKLSRLKAYIRRRGDGNVPKYYTTKNGFNLGVWVTTQRYLFNLGLLNEWKYNLLKKLPGWRWSDRRRRKKHLSGK